VWSYFQLCLLTNEDETTHPVTFPILDQKFDEEDQEE